MEAQLKPADAGFTLIEVAVVIAMLSVLSVGSMLALRDTGETQWVDSARLLETHASMRRTAVLTGRPISLLVTAKGQQQQTWQPHLDPTQPWAESGVFIPFEAPVAFDPPAPQHRIVFLPTGQITPVRIRISGTTCHTGLWEPLTCAP